MIIRIKNKSIEKPVKNLGDFDPDFYISEYPFVSSYLKGSTVLSSEEKLLHHYENYGKSQGMFKSKKDKDSSLVDIEYKVSDLIAEEELTCPVNNLESIFLLTSMKEVENKKLFKFLDHICETTRASKLTQGIEFNIVFNQSYSEVEPFYRISEIFKNTSLISLDIAPQEDVYLKTLKPGQPLPRYGLKSGPNITFFESISLAKEYNTVLFLETDCFLGTDWLTRLNDYVKSANGFLVSGGIYDGLVFSKTDSVMATHINGGTALYATGNPILQKVVGILKIFIEKQVAHAYPDVAYDFAIKQFIDYNINKRHDNLKERLVWQFISRNYLPCKLIVNCSCEQDCILDTDALFARHNYAILHKK